MKVKTILLDNEAIANISKGNDHLQNINCHSYLFIFQIEFSLQFDFAPSVVQNVSFLFHFKANVLKSKTRPASKHCLPID